MLSAPYPYKVDCHFHFDYQVFYTCTDIDLRSLRNCYSVHITSSTFVIYDNLRALKWRFDRIEKMSRLTQDDFVNISANSW